jgi:hypothetical protein
MLKYDRQIFSTFDLSRAPNAAELKALLGVHGLSAAELNAWLEARVQVIVNEGFNSRANLVVMQPRYAYPQATVFPYLEPITSTLPPGKGVLIMANVGVSSYETGKRQGNLLGMAIDGVGTIPLTSPRSGIIQIGPGLFNPPQPVDAAQPMAVANAIPRIGTFFHESRHSDGNGASLGFYHAVCPDGHKLHGNYACDRNLNGPYTVGAQMMKAMTETCTQCTVAQIEQLRLRYTDSFGRVLPKMLDGKTPTYNWNDAPEGTR